MRYLHWLVFVVAAVVLTGCYPIQRPMSSSPRYIVVTPVPADKEMSMRPSGYIRCSVVAAGWRDNVWMAARKVCYYSRNASGSMWVSGYWQCMDSNPMTGQCNSWSWVSSHWMNR